MTSRRWCFTLNNPSEEESTRLQEILRELRRPIRYCCYGEEVGATGTPHLQGYVELFSPSRLSGMKKLISPRAHFEKARGNGQENRTYCSKDGMFHEAGAMGSGQGERNDLNQVRDMIRDGATEREIATDHFGSWVRYRGAFRAYRTLINTPVVSPDFALSTFPEEWRSLESFSFQKSLVLWGPPGTGKSSFACSLLPGALFVSHIDQLTDFQPELHTGIIFDDVSFTHFPIGSQIHLVDMAFDRAIHVRYQVATIPKGTKKIFTTNIEGGAIFDLRPEYGVKRRVSIHKLDMWQ